MKIRKVVTSVGRSGFFNWDMMALKRGAKPNGFLMEGEPLSPGFKSIVQPGSALSIMLVLEDGQVAFGDCVDVIFTGAAGRDPPPANPSCVDLRCLALRRTTPRSSRAACAAAWCRRPP